MKLLAERGIESAGERVQSTLSVFHMGRCTTFLFALLAVSALADVPRSQLRLLSNSSGTLTVSGSTTSDIVHLSVNSTNARIYSDATFATTSGMALHDGNNLFVTAG